MSSTLPTCDYLELPPDVRGPAPIIPGTRRGIRRVSGLRTDEARNERNYRPIPILLRHEMDQLPCNFVADSFCGVCRLDCIRRKPPPQRMAMPAGFLSSYPVNRWLINRGIKEAM